MSRRIGGALLLLAALIALLCLRAQSGSDTAGVASAVPVPPAPRAGDCLTSISDMPEQNTVSSSAVQLPAAVVGSCESLLAGEVVGIDSPASGRQAPHTTATTDDACAQRAATFLGLPAGRTIAGIIWTPGLATGSQEIGPDMRQWAAGQRWSACAVTGAAARYRGSIRASVSGGVVPNALGLCWPDVVKMDADLASCSVPHRSQLLAIGVVDGTASIQLVTLNASCRQFAAAVLGGLDPEVAGALTVMVAAQGIDPQVLLCSVSAVAHRQLLGSVLGIGARPLPLTG